MRSTVQPLLGLIIVGLMFAGIASLAGHALYLDEEFETSTHRCQATIEHDWTTHGRKSGTFYHTRYHFTDDKGHGWTDSCVISSSTYRHIQVGTVVPVKYLETDPSQSRIDLPDEAAWNWHRDEALGGIGLFVGAIGVLILVTQRRSIFGSRGVRYDGFAG